MVQKFFGVQLFVAVGVGRWGKKFLEKKIAKMLDKGGLLVIYLHRQTGVRPSVFDKNQVAVEKFFNNITRCTSAR